MRYYRMMLQGKLYMQTDAVIWATVSPAARRSAMSRLYIATQAIRYGTAVLVKESIMEELL